jgi:hypothetical protein
MLQKLPALAAVTLLLTSTLLFAQSVTWDQIFALGFKPDQKAAFESGEVISSGFEELSDKELALAMAVLIPAPMEKVIGFSRSKNAFEVNKDILAHGTLEGGDTKAFLASAQFDASESDEINKLIAVEPGSTFNLSAGEVARFQALRKKHPGNCAKDATCAGAVMNEYRGVLEARLKAYQAKGLAGIEPYTRGSKSAEPAKELTQAAEAMTLAQKTFPQFYDAFRNYPKGGSSNVEHTFLWFKQMVQDRPTFILSHRMAFQSDDLMFRIERHFYVGQSYNSLQIVIGLLPSGDKTSMFYLNRTSTDQVAGFMSGTRHSMGRKIMEKEIRKLFDAALTAVKS